MAAMDFMINNTVVGKVLDYKQHPKAQKIVSTALSGSVYIQKTGGQIMRYDVDVYCSNATKRANLDAACYNGDLVTFVKRNNFSVSGYIEDDEITWKEWTDGHGVGHFTIIEE